MPGSYQCHSCGKLYTVAGPEMECVCVCGHNLTYSGYDANLSYGYTPNSTCTHLLTCSDNVNGCIVKACRSRTPKTSLFDFGSSLRSSKKVNTSMGFGASSSNISKKKEKQKYVSGFYCHNDDCKNYGEVIGFGGKIFKKCEECGKTLKAFPPPKREMIVSNDFCIRAVVWNIDHWYDNNSSDEARLKKEAKTRAIGSMALKLNLDVIMLNEANDARVLRQHLANVRGVNVHTGPELKFYNPTTQSYRGGGEFYPLIVCNDEIQVDENILVFYHNDDRQYRKNGVVAAVPIGTPRPIVMYHAIKNGQEFGIAIVHTKPISSNEFDRYPLYPQVDYFLDYVQNECPYPVIIGGDWYLTPQANVIARRLVKPKKRNEKRENEYLEKMGIKQRWDSERREMELSEEVRNDLKRYKTEHTNRQKKRGSGNLNLRENSDIYEEFQNPNKFDTTPVLLDLSRFNEIVCLQKGLQFVVPCSATHISKDTWKDQYVDLGVAESAKFGIADFFLCTAEFDTCFSVVLPVDLDLNKPIASDCDHWNLKIWSEISDHAPVFGFFSFKDNDPCITTMNSHRNHINRWEIYYFRKIMDSYLYPHLSPNEQSESLYRDIIEKICKDTTGVLDFGSGNNIRFKRRIKSKFDILSTPYNKILDEKHHFRNIFYYIYEYYKLTFKR